MEKTNISILPSSVGMLIVSCIQINQLTRLYSLLENGRKKIMSLQFGSNAKKRILMYIGNVGVIFKKK